MRRIPGETWRKRRTLGAVVLALVVCARGLASGEASRSPATFGQELSRIGKKGIGPSQMVEAQAVAVDSQGFVYAGDRELGRVQRFNSAGKLESLHYFDEGRITSLACDRAGVLYVLIERRLLRYDPKTWTLLGEVEHPGDSEFLAVAPGPDGGVIALRDNSHDDILLIDRNGKITRTFHDAVYAVSDYSLHEPFVAVDRGGFIYVGDEGTHRIYKFDPQGRFISRFGFSADPADPSRENIHGLAIDSQGHLWVAGWSSVNVFSSDGRFLEHFGDRRAHDLVIDDQDALYAAEWTQVTKYAAGKR